MMDDMTILSLEIVGEMLGFNGDKAIWECLNWRWADESPNFMACKTFAQQPKSSTGQEHHRGQAFPFGPQSGHCGLPAASHRQVASRANSNMLQGHAD